MKYYSIGKFAKLIDKTEQTLRNWDKKDILKSHHVTKSGYRYYSQQQLNYFLGIKNRENEKRKTIGYCRVSSNKQKDDLERQVENVKIYMYSKGYQFEIITDIRRGINYNNKGLNKLLDDVTNSEVEKIIVLYKDRLIILLPNKKQYSKLFECARVRRFAYNWTLAKEQENYKKNEKFISDNELRKEFTKLKKTEEYK